eukprot:TRINITY_DN1790_c2_g1_i1.p2 TRINITY_DN1790_c2_g1~~TRINITY_DN1790_c2_g1_i1.p2  ORF type:complete len:125 (-),score=27.49 TRINITY_DN1790_c2_g1_i1:141-485(-)
MGILEGIVIASQIILLLYALLLVCGGGFAYLRTKSMVSLVAGLSSGAFFGVLFVVSWFLFIIAMVLAIVGGIVMVVFFGLRYYTQEKFMPMGLLACITVFATVCFIIGLIVGIF